MKRQLAALLVLGGILLFTAAATAAAKGDPQGPRKQQWLCVLDQRNWHCIPPGEDVDAVLAGQAASAPSVNYGCETRADPLCAGFAVSETGPPPGTVFVGTENGIRIDLYAGQPCPRDEPVPVDFTGDGLPDYVFCHHYGDS